MAPDDFESILPDFRKKGLKPPKNSVFFCHFWKIIELNTDVLEPLLSSDIDNWSLLLKMNSKLIACNLKVGGGFMSRGAREKETHYGGP